MFRLEVVSANTFLHERSFVRQVLGIVSEMFRLEVAKDTAIIRQGDTGDYFYVVESGLFEIFVRYDGLGLG